VHLADPEGLDFLAFPVDLEVLVFPELLGCLVLLVCPGLLVRLNLAVLEGLVFPACPERQLLFPPEHLGCLDFLGFLEIPGTLHL
jgi:hypothetical protein